MLEMKGLYLPDERRLACAEERDNCFAWIADKINVTYSKLVKTHGNPSGGGRRRVSDKTRTTFESFDQMRERKKFINTTNARGA